MSVHNEAGHGCYQIGYRNRTAFTAERKTNKEARKFSQKVTAGTGSVVVVVFVFFIPSCPGSFFFVSPCSRSERLWNKRTKHLRQAVSGV